MILKSGVSILSLKAFMYVCFLLEKAVKERIPALRYRVLGFVSSNTVYKHSSYIWNRVTRKLRNLSLFE